MNITRKIALTILCGIGIYSTLSIAQEATGGSYPVANNQRESENNELIFPLAQQGAMPTENSQASSPIDLKDPDNVQSSIEYDPVTGHYIIRSTVAGEDISNPYVLNSEEYKEYSMQRSMQGYWKEKNSVGETPAEKKGFDPASFGMASLGSVGNRIFGEGGVQVKTQGSAELSFGLKKNKIDNPTLTERSRNPPPTFDFDEKIQLSVRGTVGEKISLAMNYNTEASFDYDQQLIKLAYEGKEDEIIQKIEAGNISMPLSTSLITGSSALFGIKTQLKFGRLTVDAVVSQQESESQTVSLRNGAQTTSFEISADSYDENRHFFLSHYFYENYDKAMSTLPYINSPIKINRIEVWVTNKRGNYDDARNIVPFVDLGEPKVMNPDAPWKPTAEKYPSNNANGLYGTVTALGVRNIDDVSDVLQAGLPTDVEVGEDYDKIESARLLNSSEYTVNYELGYISLRAALNSDEVLAVAYEYTVGGNPKPYQVGEFSTDVKAPENLVLKMLKGTNLHPGSNTWNLMMKNVYALGGYQLQKDKFELNVMYQSDSTGVYLNYLPAKGSGIEDVPLIKVMNLDRLDNYNEPRPDGFFDFVEGYTVISATGRVIFPVVQPFGSHLYKKMGNNPNYEKYTYQELYDLTLVEAQEFSEKNKFRLRGKYKASSGSEIRLNAMNIPRGSVSVTAGGVRLSENVDYTVDYAMGTVNIINSDILDSGTSIDVSLENQSYFNTQRKTLLGTHLDYKINNDFNVGGTIMHMSEKPLTQKVNMGSEPISNTIWGLNTSYRTESQWLTDVLDKIPVLKATAPSSIAVNGEFAHLIPGTSKVINNYAYLDDFESAKIGIDIRMPYNWKLSSTPVGFVDSTNWDGPVSYGYKRALLAWYYIDNVFYNRGSEYNQDMVSHHFTREVKEREVFPNREEVYGQTNQLSILNLSYYPKERGPYNLNAKGLNNKGELNKPEDSWGGIMRKLETSDFETANIEYIEFWMMDPFAYNADKTMSGGELRFNLGDISEDILKDGKKSFESGLPTDGDMSKVIETDWGRVPKIQSLVTAFQSGNVALQDLGLNGLSDEDEKNYKFYASYIAALKGKVDQDVQNRWNYDPFSPFNDPAGDNYHYFRGSDFTGQESILERYKHYNGTQGNSTQSGESYSTTATSQPDVEDINADNTLNETNRYYEYVVKLNPEEMTIEKNDYIVDVQEAAVTFDNGEQSSVKWYQFKIPIREYTKTVGNIKNFKSLRFARIYLTGFEQEMHLRFASMELVRGDWRKYNKDLFYNTTDVPASNGTIDVSAVNIEENARKSPVNYVIPPGVSRVADPSQPQLRQENEQALVMSVKNLDPRDSRAIYKNTGMDMRQYKRLQMFVHAEKPEDDDTNLKDDELTAFIRLGSDHTQNFYEYEIPLRLTPAGSYNNDYEADRWRVWPEDNMFNFPLDVLVQTKNERNRLRTNASSGVALTKPFFKSDPDKPNNMITVVGNPSISEVQVIMIGVRNKSNEIKTAEIWVNELRLSEFNQDGGYAALANAVVNLSDFGSVTVGGRIESVGFGSIEQGVMDRNMDETVQLNFAAGLELGRFLPEKAKIRIPFYYSQSRETSTPKYNPLDQDVKLEDALDNAPNKSARDSIKDVTQTVTDNRSISFSNVKVDIQSKKPQFYDPTNFSVGYTYNETKMHDPEIEYELTKNHRGVFNYNYSTTPKPYEPFAKVNMSKSLKLIKDFNVNYIPSYIAYNNTINRYYYEMQVRDLTGAGPDNKLYPSWRQDFTWSRNFDLKYDFSRSLKFTFSTAINSRIDEPYVIVNKDLYPDEYERWKDSVWSNIKKFGRPMEYQQMFTADYNVPLNKIQALNWITARGTYNTTYNWERGVTSIAEDGAEISLGNTASNVATWQIDSRLNLETLYKKSSYLGRVNDRFSGRKPQQNQQPKKYNERVTLKAGDKKDIRHRLGSTNIEVTATDANGNSYPVKFRKVDQHTISIRSKTDVSNLNVTVTTVVKEETAATLVRDGAVRGLMMVRNISGTYKETNSLILPGYQASTGFIGQDSYKSTKAPGYDFVFGFYESDKYIRKALGNEWILFNDSISNPVSVNHSTDLQLRASIEPIRSLRIELTAMRSTSENQSVQFYKDNFGQDQLTKTFSGSFSITQAAIGTSFWKIGEGGNFDSKAYDKFLSYRKTIAGRIENEYIKNGQETYNGYNLNSSDVLIPAFLAAYTNKNATRSPLDIFPKLLNMMPNWRITYNGLSNIDVIKKYFRSVNLTHSYRCTYNVGSYTSLLGWQAPDGGGHYGYIESALDGSMLLSSEYEVGTVTITESFSPLLGIDVTTQNNITFKVEYKRARTLSLSVVSTQLIESFNHEWVFGAGYKLKNINELFGLKSRGSNDLTVRGDIGIKDIKAIIRRIEEDYSQPTSGSKALTIRFTADYMFSDMVNVGLYFDRMSNTPFISTSYPTVSTDFGVTFRFMLTR